MKQFESVSGVKMTSAVCAALMAVASATLAQESPPVDLIYEEVLVTGGADGVRQVSGSASLLDESQIRAFDSTDINNLLRQVPGVYLRVEDGYGLRPNIGLRGATSERSQKITLMEDGVLIAPAPYSAPAAYYMPNVNRMNAIEVFKGPSAIKYGPHTVGGALNLVTPPVPEETQGQVEAVYGSDNYQKYRATYGDSLGQWGYWVDGLRYSADGFKDLDGGGDTGFVRNDLNAKIQWRSDPNSELAQQVQLKLGYADEVSDETYLGLTDEDFDEKSERRYVASQLDEFDSEHWQAHLFHTARFSDNLQINTQVYYNQFQRDWFKYDGFLGFGAPPTSVVLANPEQFGRELQLLRGEVNSDGTDRETLDVTDFRREFVSTGIETRVKYDAALGNALHALEFGVRYHYDQVEREQEQFGYLMTDGQLVADNQDSTFTLSNDWDTTAIALHFADRIDWGAWSVDIGLRYEDISGDAENRLSGTTRSSDQDVWLPGLGVIYNLNDQWQLLAGVNKGFSPASPGAGADIDPEESINYEYGVRYTDDRLSADVIGFFSDYENLLGRCRVSDPNCDVGEEFNGGEVEIAGVEATATTSIPLTDNLWMPISVVYTYTETAFQTTFLSNFSQWNPGFFEGRRLPVLQGDELPYTPDHQARLQLGLASTRWALDLAVRYVSEMREVPGRGDYESGESTEAYTIVDLAASYDLTEALSLRFVAENLADEQVIVSRRPFGARPNLPQQFKLGVSYSF